MLAIATFLLKLIGLGDWLDKLLSARLAKKQAQANANVPTNKQETIDYLNDK